MSEAKFDYEKVNKKLQEFLKSKKFTVEGSYGDSNRNTFTYHCTEEGMPFWVKLAVSVGNDEKRIRTLKNEVAALDKLWGLFPNGETEGFMLPPGAETIWEEEYEGMQVYGYSRFYVEGEILGKLLREKEEMFSAWTDKYVKMLKTIDALPDLDLPRTKEKKEKVKKEPYEELIVKNAKTWQGQLKEYGLDQLNACLDEIVAGVEEYFGNNTLVMGTVHGDLVPDHLIYLEGEEKPTLVNFGKLSQWYPRYWDVASVYGWVQAVLGDEVGAMAVWGGIVDSGLKKDEIEYLRHATNVATMGMMCFSIDPNPQDPSANSITKGLGCEVFV